MVQRAIDGDDLVAVARLARDAFAYLAQRDAEAEAVAWLDQALARGGDAPSAVRGRLLVVRALAAAIFGEFTRARSLLAEGRPLLPDDADHAFDHVLAATADAYSAMADEPTQASALIKEAAGRFAAVGDELGQAYMEVTGGNLALHLGELESAGQHYRTAAQLAEHVGDDAVRGRALSLFGLTLLARGDVEGARLSVIDGARANRRGGQPTSMAYSLDGLAAVALARGRPAVAARALAAADALRERRVIRPRPHSFPC